MDHIMMLPDADASNGLATIGELAMAHALIQWVQNQATNRVRRQIREVLKAHKVRVANLDMLIDDLRKATQ